jgi:serine/threonine-protein kinase
MMNNRIGAYTLEKLLGRGAMGIVYKALDPRSGRHVAIKVMSAELSEEEELVERFRREAMAASQLDHPNITRVFDFGEEGRQLYMTMELLEGSELKQLIESQAIADLGTKLSIMTQAAAGMAFVHDLDIVHRDLKPGNIHVDPRGHVKIMDFGLVRLSDSQMTRAGMAMGSPAYMAPELLMGKKADPRADVFSLGAVFYELIAGRRAFLGKSVPQILMNVMNAEPEALSTLAPATPPTLIAVIETCLKKNPDERYPHAGTLHQALEASRASLS